MATNRLLAHPRMTSPLAPAASRASWIGTLQVEDLSVPVKAFATIASSSAMQLHQVHRDCGHRISYRKTCSRHGAVPADQIGKAYQYSNDCLVELSSDELAQLTPADDKTITLERFFPGNQLDLTLLAGRSLFLSPANPTALPRFVLLKTALMQKQIWALGRTVFSQRRQLVVLQPVEGNLLLHTLHDPGTRRASISLHENRNSPSRPELRALTKMIDAASGPLDLSAYQDDSEAKLMTLIQSKLVGKANQRRKRVSSNANGQKPLKRRTRVKAA